MTVSISATALVAASTSTTTSSGLVKAGANEYTAASVSTDPTDASKLGLVKEKDGNYGTANPNQVQPISSNSAQVSANTQSALAGLMLGGA